MKEYTCKYEQFLKDIANHSMDVLLDNGIYRHLNFSAGGSFNQKFQITTWPNYLCISGDMGCYVFSRVEDMFEFFRGPLDRINPQYWSEKLQSDSEYVGCMKYSEERFLEAVKDYFDTWVEDENPSDQEKTELWARIKDEVLNAEHEHDAHRRASEFEHNEELFFTDFWERNLKDYTGQFIWCLYAIVYAIHQYDQQPEQIAKAQQATAKIREAKETKEMDAEEYQLAIKVVRESGNATISKLQRELKLGYNRCARLMEAMEVDGIVGPLEPLGGRKVIG